MKCRRKVENFSTVIKGNMPTCEGVTKKGNPCRNHVAKGFKRCHHHVETFECSSCAICLSDMDSEKKTLRCGHQFHESCILEWLSRSSTCPHCRRNVGRSMRSWADRKLEDQNDTDSEWVPEEDHWHRLGNEVMMRRRRRRRVGISATRRNRLLIHTLRRSTIECWK